MTFQKTPLGQPSQEAGEAYVFPASGHSAVTAAAAARRQHAASHLYVGDICQAGACGANGGTAGGGEEGSAVRCAEVPVAAPADTRLARGRLGMEKLRGAEESTAFAALAALAAPLERAICAVHVDNIAHRAAARSIALW